MTNSTHDHSPQRCIHARWEYDSNRQEAKYLGCILRSKKANAPTHPKCYYAEAPHDECDCPNFNRQPKPNPFVLHLTYH